MRIDRCVCDNVSFAALKSVAERNACATVVELQKHEAFGRTCRLCVPYVKRMLQTGEVVFHDVIVDDD